MRTVEPGSPAAPSIFDTSGLFTAWGIAQGVFTAGNLAERAAAAGFGWVALQAGQHTLADATAITRRGLGYVVWGIPPIAGHGADAYIVQVENADQRAAALEQKTDGIAPFALVTTFGGADTRELAAPLAAKYDTTFVECYLQDDPIHGDLARMLWQAGAYGFPNAIPVVGLYRSVGLAAYTPSPLTHPLTFAVWNAEQMREQDWNDVAEANRVRKAA